jgi:uncharacterized protein YbaR (Trm112 family)
MKPWLLEILACPIDKHYPLRLEIFKIENEDSVIATIADSTAQERDLGFFFVNPGAEPAEMADVKVINASIVEDKLLIFDTLVRKPVPVIEYLDGIRASIGELVPVTDKSDPAIAELLASLLALGDEVDALKAEIGVAEDQPEKQQELFGSLETSLVKLNWFKQAVEIEEGVMVCDECHRWYPIRETIPQMLPDGLRKEKYDLDFLEKWKQTLDEAILSEGLPFHS